MKFVLLAFSFLALSLPVLADSASKKKPSASTGASRPSLDAEQELAFKSHDLDGDGLISKAEAAGSELINAFDRFDRNRDGKLSRAEYARAIAPKRQAAR